MNGNFRRMSKFETEAILKQSRYYYHKYYFVVAVVDVVNIFNYSYHTGQAVSKYVAE